MLVLVVSRCMMIVGVHDLWNVGECARCAWYQLE